MAPPPLSMVALTLPLIAMSPLEKLEMILPLPLKIETVVLALSPPILKRGALRARSPVKTSHVPESESLPRMCMRDGGLAWDLKNIGGAVLPEVLINSLPAGGSTVCVSLIVTEPDVDR